MSKRFLTPPNLPSGLTLPAVGRTGDLFYLTDDEKIYVHNGTAWVVVQGAGGGGGSSIIVSTLPPSGASVGDVWFNSATGREYIKYDTYWVEIATGTSGPEGEVGPVGPQGLPGEDGAPGLNWRGIWSSSASYYVGDGVSYGGSSYRYKGADGGSSAPGLASSDWDLLAQAGLPGAPGANGSDGADGAPGAKGDKGDPGDAGPAGADGASGGITLTVTNSGASSYTINGASNPTLSFIRGHRYVINVNAPGHPFWIQTVAGAYSAANVYNTGVTNNGTAVGTIIFEVPFNAPQLYYVCQFHSTMAGSAIVSNLGPTGAAGPAGPAGPEGPAGADSTVPGPEGPQGPSGVVSVSAPIVNSGTSTSAALSLDSSVAILTSTQTLTNKTLTSPVLAGATAETWTTGGTFSGYTFYAGTVGSIAYLWSANATSSGAVNLSWTTGTALGNYLAVGQSMTFTLIVPNGGTGYYVNNVQVDGTTTGVTTRWAGGTAPSSGNANSKDSYTFTVFKEATGVYQVFASLTKFA